MKSNFNKVKAYIELGLKEGARLVSGGLEKPEGDEFKNGLVRKANIIC